MEKWKPIKEGQFCDDHYTVKIEHSEKNGLNIVLKGVNSKYIVSFGYIASLRMLERDNIQIELYSGDSFEKHKQKNFDEIIYVIEKGLYKDEIIKIASGYIGENDVKHYVVMSSNYCIEVIAMWEPVINYVISEDGEDSI